MTRTANKYVLDTSAILALRSDEPGADRVEKILRQGSRTKGMVLVSFISRMEMLYRIERDEGAAAAADAVRLLDAAGVEWVSCSEEILVEAARMKVKGGLSLADAWIGATARLAEARLVHKDPEFDSIADLLQERLPGPVR